MRTNNVFDKCKEICKYVYESPFATKIYNFAIWLEHFEGPIIIVKGGKNKFWTSKEIEINYIYASTSFQHFHGQKVILLLRRKFWFVFSIVKSMSVLKDGFFALFKDSLFPHFCLVHFFKRRWRIFANPYTNPNSFLYQPRPTYFVRYMSSSLSF